jgi:ComF family protein
MELCVTHVAASREWQRLYGVQTITTLGAYRQAAWREAVGLFKFHRVRGVADVFGAELSRALVRHEYTAANAVLVPIPLHPARERERGFNQSALVAHAVGRRLGIPVAADALRRVVHSASQTTRTHEERLRSMGNVFALGRQGAWARGRHVLLVDDVITTGATIAAAARVLKTQQPQSIHVVAVAHGN